MGLLNFINSKVEGSFLKMANTMVGFSPSFAQFGNDIMQDDTVKTIVNRALDEYSKLNPRHIKTYKGKQIDVSKSNINYVLNNPNKLMTKSDFLRKCAWLRETYNNCFIYPTYDIYYNKSTKKFKRVYKELYPLHVTQVDFYEDEGGNLFVDFTFPKGEHSGKLAYDDIIHWRKDFSENEYLGGGADGFPDNSSLLKYLDTNDKLIQATFKSIEGSMKINGVVKIGSLMKKEFSEATRRDFEKQLEEGKYSFLTLDNGADYTPIPYYGKNIGDNILKFFDNKIRNHYGTSEAIVSGDYTNEQKEAYYETVLEAGIIGLGLAFSRVMLTPQERKTGNEITFYTSRVQMMSADKKLRLAELLLPTGGVSNNQVLGWFGEMPYEGGDERMMSLNYIKTKDASKYQLGNDSNSSDSENKFTNNENSDTIKTKEGSQ